MAKRGESGGKRIRRAGSRGVRPSKYRIFVSHATVDKWVAKVICERLEAAGATTFRDDRDIDGGDKIPERIREEIRRCQEFVVLLTPRSFDRPWVLLEVGMAFAMSGRPRIVPVLYHASADVIPDMIKDRSAVSLNDFEEFVEEVRKRIERSKL